MRRFWAMILGIIVSAGLSAGADLVQEVRHELLLGRGYTVFDWITYRVDGGKVTLMGSVVSADLKRDSGNAVKKIKGVSSVQNDIEVLPASAGDERIRMGVLRSINDQMAVYLVQEVKQIHIIVKGGNVTLEGEIPGQADKDRVSALAKRVQDVSNVTNNLAILK